MANPPRFTSRYTGPTGSGQDRGYFYFRLDGLDSLIRNAEQQGIGKIWARELAKELDLLKADLEEVYKAYAPVKEGSGGLNDRDHWSNDRPLLRDTIEARKTLGSTTLQLRMAWWGKFTTDGRAAQGPRERPYRIELPGGEVIYRHSTGAATIHSLDGVSAQRRMNWPKEAYHLLVVNKVFQQHALNLTTRYYYAVMRSLDKLGRQGVPRNVIRALSNRPPGGNNPRNNFAAQLREAKARRAALREHPGSIKHRQYAHAGRPGRPRKAHAPTIKHIHAERHQHVTREAMQIIEHRNRVAAKIERNARVFYHKAAMQRAKEREAKGLPRSRIRRFDYGRKGFSEVRSTMQYEGFESFFRHHYVIIHRNLSSHTRYRKHITRVRYTRY